MAGTMIASLAGLTTVAEAQTTDGHPETEKAKALARATALLEVRCLRCHNAAKKNGDLDLSTRETLLVGGSGGPCIDAANPDQSSLLRMIRHLDEPYMPHEEERLGPQAIADIAAWVKAGTPYDRPLAPRSPGSNPQAFKDFWSLRPLSAVELPAVKQANWVRTPLDAFVLAGLEARDLGPTSAADKRQLIRRACFDLLGLPPSPEETAAFLADETPDAYERLVDRLLADPHFGEQWGRHWLDVVRYADSNGFEGDEDRPNAYAYRDFVIRALNDDLPFDAFVRWQLAADELEPDNLAAQPATGFGAAGPALIYTKNDGTPLEREQSRYNELDDMLSTTASAFLGLTVACARCHDHKFDPISQHDYYRLMSAFVTTTRQERLDLPATQAADYERRQREFSASLATAQRTLSDWSKPFVEQVRVAKIDRLVIVDAERESLKKPVDPNDKQQKELLKAHGGKLQASEDDLRAIFSETERARWEELTAAVKTIEATRPAEPPRMLVLTDSQAEPLPSHFLERGEVDRKREVQPLGFLNVFAGDRSAQISRPAEARTTFQRAALARWLTNVHDGAGQLLARVIANRLWQHHFGAGLVRTSNDFGQQGERPSHPELLDWLAGQLIDGGWRLKPLHRMMVTSAAYRQGTAWNPAAAKIDPDDRLLWRRRPQRLSAENLRDAMLAVSGSLNWKMFGPAVKPAIPAEALAGRNKDNKVPRPKQDGPEQWRRSVYLFVKRSIPTPILDAFDAPNASASCGRRTLSTVAPQALLLLNDPFVRNQAQRFAALLRAEAPQSPSERIDRAFVRALGRPPTDEQRTAALAFLAGRDDDGVWANFCQTLFSLNEFSYID